MIVKKEIQDIQGQGEQEKSSSEDENSMRFQN